MRVSQIMTRADSSAPLRQRNEKSGKEGRRQSVGAQAGSTQPAHARGCLENQCAREAEWLRARPEPSDRPPCSRGKRRRMSCISGTGHFSPGKFHRHFSGRKREIRALPTTVSQVPSVQSHQYAKVASFMAYLPSEFLQGAE